MLQEPQIQIFRGHPKRLLPVLLLKKLPLLYRRHKPLQQHDCVARQPMRSLSRLLRLLRLRALQSGQLWRKDFVITSYSIHYTKLYDLITVGEGTHEELKIPDIRYKRKLHLGFKSPYKGAKSQDEIREKCKEVRDELLTEMDYFYNFILKREASAC